MVQSASGIFKTERLVNTMGPAEKIGQILTRIAILNQNTHAFDYPIMAQVFPYASMENFLI